MLGGEYLGMGLLIQGMTTLLSITLLMTGTGVTGDLGPPWKWYPESNVLENMTPP